MDNYSVEDEESSDSTFIKEENSDIIIKKSLI